MNKRKKNTRQRGSHTHGYGSKKKHRGAGSRGGRGMAGSGKRADTKKPITAKIKNYFGVHGFTSVRRVTHQAINLNTLQTRLPNLVEQKLATVKDGVYTVDLTKTKYTKLLGSGSITVPVNVVVDHASARAVQKVEEAKGTVTVLKAETDESAKESADEAEA